MPPTPSPLISSVVWCFLVRDAERYLESNANRLVTVSDRVASSWNMQFLENDSTDRTRSVLRNLELAHPGRVRGEMLDVSSFSSLSLCRRAGQQRNCKARTYLLASLRQRLLEAALKRNTTLLVMVDIDFITFDDKALVRLFHLHAALEADGVFGVSVNKRGGLLYDTGAVEPQSALSQMMSNHITPVRVRSAFSGFGIYSTAAIVTHNASYLAPFPARSGRAAAAGDVEHVRFNARLAKLFVHPTFRPVYR